jgi:hypothetical protein
MKSRALAPILAVERCSWQEHSFRRTEPGRRRFDHAHKAHGQILRAAHGDAEVGPANRKSLFAPPLVLSAARVIHQIDECFWIKDAWPVSAHGVGGRVAGSTDASQNLDSYSIDLANSFMPLKISFQPRLSPRR